MLTEQQIEDQKEFERKQISGGLDRLHSNTKNLEEKPTHPPLFMAQHV